MIALSHDIPSASLPWMFFWTSLAVGGFWWGLKKVGWLDRESSGVEPEATS